MMITWRLEEALGDRKQYRWHLSEGEKEAATMLGQKITYPEASGLRLQMERNMESRKDAQGAVGCNIG